MYQIIFDTWDISKFNGHCQIDVRIYGYWSHAPISLLIHKNSENTPIKYKLTHSSGGRDSFEKTPITDAQAERYFGTALIMAADLLEKIQMELETSENTYPTILND